MAPALRLRIEASLHRKRAGEQQRSTSRMIAVARLGLMASLALVLVVLLMGR